MTEAEWLGCNEPESMLEFIWGQRPRAYGVYDPTVYPLRQLTLFKVACCRAVWLYLSIPGKEAVEVLERFVEGAATELEFTTGIFLQYSHAGARDGMILRGLAYSNGSIHFADELAAALAVSAGCAEVDLRSPSIKRLARQSSLVRDIFNPFHPVTADSSWFTSTVVTLATGIYADKAFDRLPILADALQDAGCDNTDILDHCRQPGEHVRGCWAVDLVLGKK